MPLWSWRCLRRPLDYGLVGMSMTNREESDAAEHETYPGPGPLRGDEGKRGMRPVEQMVDAAIDRIAREQEAARNAGPGHALVRAPVEGAAALAAVRRAGGRLRWKGLDVSEEFRNYAERVARGEDLPPFTGKILAEPGAAFPWDPDAQNRAQRRAVKRQFGLWAAVAAFLGLAVWVLIVQVGNQADKPVESPLATVLLTNQPGSEEPKAEATADSPAAPAEETVPAQPATQGSTALASLTESPSANAQGAPSTVHSAPRAAPTPAAHPVGMFVATRSATTDVRAAAVSAAGIIRTPPGASDVASSAVGGSVAGVGATAADSAVTASTSTRAVAGVTGIAGVATASDVASPSDPSLRADPKKEPGREASAMGPLLVESPSF
jgi:hypothetical protein